MFRLLIALGLIASLESASKLQISCFSCSGYYDAQLCGMHECSIHAGADTGLFCFTKIIRNERVERNCILGSEKCKEELRLHNLPASEKNYTRYEFCQINLCNIGPTGGRLEDFITTERPDRDFEFNITIGIIFTSVFTVVISGVVIGCLIALYRKWKK